MRRSNSPESTVQFAGLTRHNNVEMEQQAASIAGLDADEPPETSLASAIHGLEQATESDLAWQVPDEATRAMDVQDFNEASPEGVEAFETATGEVFIRTERFQSVISPDKVRDYAKGDFTDDSDEFRDALWHVPTKDYSIVNPTTAYEPLEEAIRDEDLGDSVFGEIRSYKSGGEVHMDILFDAYTIDYNDDDDGRDPIVLGIRTGYDFFGGTALYFEGFAQDTRCSNSIRSVTEEKTIRHVGEVDLEDEVADVLEELGLMTDRLAELIELAEDIEVELLDMDFAAPFDHDDNLRAMYELSGFPSYLAREAANHARSRAENQFMPDMTDVWDGATYALTHHYRGGENTNRAQELIDSANDFIYNPSQAIGQVQQEHQRRLASQSEESGEQVDLKGESAHASIEEFTQSVKDKRDEFESRNEELRQTLVAEAGGDGEQEVATDGGTDE